MKAILGVVAAGAVAALSFASMSPAAPFASTASPHFPPWGFDLAGRDAAVKPGDDFYAYANGTYVKKLQIPPDRSRFGNFDGLQALSEDRIHTLLDKAAANLGAAGEPGKVGAYYRAFMDERLADALGARPLGPDLAAIRAADNRAAIAALMGRASSSCL